MDIIGFLPLLALVLLLAVTVAWLVSEVRARAAIRITLGILSIAGWVVGALWVADIIPTYERGFHRRALEQAGKLLADGRIAPVTHAVQVYNDQIRLTGSSYGASHEMLKALRSSTNEVATPGKQ